MHTEDTTYRLLPSSITFESIEATHPIYSEPVESTDWRDAPGTYTQAVIGQERELLHFRLSSDGAMAVSSQSKDLPGWHHVETLPAGSTPADVLEWVKGRAFVGRQFWEPA